MDERQVAPAQGPVDLLVVEEVVFPHGPRPFEKGSACHQARSRDEVELGRIRRGRVGRGVKIVVPCHAGHVVHETAVDLDAVWAFEIEDPPSHQPVASDLADPGGQCVERLSGHDAVGIQHPEMGDVRIARQMGYSHIDTPRKAQIGPRLDQGDLRLPIGGEFPPSLPQADRPSRLSDIERDVLRDPVTLIGRPVADQVRGPVGRGIVDHHDPEATPVRGQQALEAVENHVGRAVADDHDADHRHVSISLSLFDQAFAGATIRRGQSRCDAAWIPVHSLRLGYKPGRTRTYRETSPNAKTKGAPCWPGYEISCSARSW